MMTLSNSSKKLPGNQRGIAMLIAMVALLGGSALFLVNGYRAESHQDRLESLLSAKQALIAYAVNYADNYGHNTRGGTGRLPCPSLQRHGSPAPYCGEHEIGFLPSVWMRDQRLMEIDYLERFFDQDIWYAVSADHRYNPSFNTLNSYPDAGLLSVDSMQEVVAVLISPGPALDFQSRSGAETQSVTETVRPASIVREYLEGENADIDGQYTLFNENDLLVPIRRSELLPLMERKVLAYVKQWLIEYKAEHGFYPYASTLGVDGLCVDGLTRGMLATEPGTCGEALLLDESFTDLPGGRALRNTWFARYEWPALVYYIVDASCTADRLSDCDGIDDPERELLVDGEPVEVILISVGAPVETLATGGMQVRGGSDLAQYFDTAALVSAVNEFSVATEGVVGNDQIVTIN